MATLIEELTTELGGATTPGVAELPEADQARLLAALREAKVRQRAALDAAIESGLGHVPALLRRPFRKMLFP